MATWHQLYNSKVYYILLQNNNFFNFMSPSYSKMYFNQNIMNLIYCLDNIMIKRKCIYIILNKFVPSKNKLW